MVYPMKRSVIFLSVSESAIKSRLHRARKQLKEELILMVEDSFDRHKLPEDFPERIVQEMVVDQILMDSDNNVPIVNATKVKILIPRTAYARNRQYCRPA